jgi:Lipase
MHFHPFQLASQSLMNFLNWFRCVLTSLVWGEFISNLCAFHSFFLSSPLVQALIRLYHCIWAEIRGHIYRRATQSLSVWRFYHAAHNGAGSDFPLSLLFRYHPHWWRIPRDSMGEFDIWAWKTENLTFLFQALGHVDFYPNGGIALQPGCVQEELSKNNFLGIVSEFKSARIAFLLMLKGSFLW